jgi:FtsP/CotA-like multicopper oxidase with cupredoxin domain
MKSIFRLAQFAVLVLAPTLGAAAEFIDPPLVHPGPSGVTIRARTATVTLPGLGETSGVYVYDIDAHGAGRANKAARRSSVPSVLEADRGQEFRIEFLNELIIHDALGAAYPADTNLHGHGLIVSPQGLDFGSRDQAYGDCIFVLSLAKGAANAASGDPCSEASDRPEMNMSGKRTHYSYTIPPDHPSGLFWIHPHPHGESEGQISNGLGALFSVGSLWDYSYIDCHVSAAGADAGADTCKTQAEQQAEIARQNSAVSPDGSVKIRYLALKDIQVTSDRAGKPPFRLIEFPRRPPPPQDPLHPTPAEAKEIAAFEDANNARKGLCGDLNLGASKADDLVYADPPTKDAADFRHGQCWSPDSPNDRWLFMVSGQIYPHIAIKPGQLEVWRVANTSADATYRLTLETTSEPVARALAFHVRALDGVPIESRKPVTEFTLMPSARIEVVLARCGVFGSGEGDCVAPGAQVAARFRTRGVATGILSPPDPNPDGDQWPPVDLATVEFEGSSHVAPGPRLKAIKPRFVKAAETKAPPASTQAAAAPAPKPAPAPPRMPKAATPAASACDWNAYKADAQVFSPRSDLVRLVRFNNDDFGGTDGEMFGLHVENRHLTDEAGNGATVQNLLDDGAQSTPAGKRSLLARISLADPCHDAGLAPADFARFYPKFVMQPNSNVSAYYGGEEYWLVVNDSRECHNFHIHQMKFSVVDADVVVDPADGKSTDQCLGDRQLSPPIAQNALHDNFPIPPGARILLRIRFDGPKLGRFVFHCHILEHEDKGMMSSIDVILPPASAESAPGRRSESGWLGRAFASVVRAYSARAEPSEDLSKLIDGAICRAPPVGFSAGR